MARCSLAVQPGLIIDNNYGPRFLPLLLSPYIWTSLPVLHSPNTEPLFMGLIVSPLVALCSTLPLGNP